MNPHAVRRVPPPPPPQEHQLWTLTKRDHQVVATVRATEMGPELRIAIDGELWWSQLFQPQTEDGMRAAADRKRDDFTAKGWA